MRTYSSQQFDKLSELTLDIAKGMFLAALAVPAVSPVMTLAISIKFILTGIFFTFLSLKLTERKEVRL